MIRIAKSFGNIFVQAVRTSLFCLFPLVMSSLIFFVPFFLLDRFFWNDETAYNRMVSILTFPGYMVVDILVSAFYVLFFFLYLIALTHIIQAFHRKEKMSFWQAYSSGIKKWRTYLFMQLSILFHTVIRIFLIYPGVVYFARHSMAGFILLGEGVTRQEALQRSRELLKGNVHYFLDQMAVVAVFLFLIFYPYFEFLERIYSQQYIIRNMAICNVIDYAQTVSMIWILIFIYIYYYYLFIDISENKIGEENESNN
jgi:hypothetical protein